MPNNNTQRYYRLRVRASDDLSDALVITSVPGGTNPYVLKAIMGDGRGFDPLDGTVSTGSYTVEVIDASTGANTRVVTAALADANARQQLLSHRAYNETSTDGTTWTPLSGGYVTSVRLVTPLVYAITIGETRRISNDREVFKSTILKTNFDGTPATFSTFDKTTCIFGGPVRGGFLWVRDLGGWRFKVANVTSSPKYVQMKIVDAFDPRKPELGHFSRLGSAIVDYMCGVAAPYYRMSPTWKSVTIRGWFPGLVYRVQTTAGAFVGNYTPLSEPIHPDKATPPNIFTRTGESSIWLAWTGTLPTVGDVYDVYMYPTDITKDNPLHIYEHPVDLRQKLWDEYGISYDASVLPAVRSAIGDNIRLALRITESPGKLKDFEALLNGLFGMGTRSDGAGREVLFTHRIKLSTTPSATIGVNDLRSFDGTVFEIDESTITNKVTIKQKRLVQRLVPGKVTVEQALKGSTGMGDDPTPDSIIEIDQAVSVNNSDADNTAYGQKETVYDLPGQILLHQSQQDFDLEKYALGVAREIFDRYGRGAIGGELHCLPAVTVDVGQEVQLNIPQLPNAQVGASPVSQRGGTRIVQVVRRTETPSGPDLYVLDSGTTAQPGTVPTFTIGTNASDAFHFADLVITNAATLAAAGYQVRIEIAVGTSTPTAGTLLSVVDPATVTSLTIPAHDAGTKVWARMRSEKEGYRPSAWSAFAGVQLTAIDPVTSLAVSAENAGDPSQRLLTWTIGTNAADYPVEVLIRLTSESSAADRLIAILPKGSTQFQLTELDIANRTATVRHREQAPFNGVSADSTIAVNTVNAAATLAAPTNPVAFSSKHAPDGLLLPPGSYGLDVNAAVFPSGVEVWVKVGAGGTYEAREIVPARPFGPTRWIGVAPSDGITRYMKARHRVPGYADSAFCAEVSVTPWSPTVGFPHFYSKDGLRRLVDVDTERLHGNLGDSAGRAVNKFLSKANVGDSDNLDGVPDGTTYKRIHNTAVNPSGYIDFSGTGFVGKNIDNIPDGSTYKRVTGVNGSNKVTQTSIASASVGPAEAQSRNRCGLWRSTTQSIPTATATAILLDSEFYDSNSLHSTSLNTDRITIPTGGNTGAWFFSAEIEWAANATGYREVTIYKNTATILATARVLGFSSSSLGPRGFVTVMDSDPAVGDYYWIGVVQNSGGNLNVVSAFFYATHLW
jgi:hypothetical protein